MAIDIFKTKSEIGIVEGDYNTWVCKWMNEPAGGLYNLYNFDALIDEKNEVLSIGYKDGSSKYRFAVYNLSDFSAVYESPTGVYYTYNAAIISSSKQAINFGLTYFQYGGLSQSLQTYLLLMRLDENTIEVWRGGSSPLWARDVYTDLGGIGYVYSGGISLTGKYVLIAASKSGVGNFLMLYEGFNI